MRSCFGILQGIDQTPDKWITLYWIECKSNLNFDDIQSTIVEPGVNCDIEKSFKDCDIEKSFEDCDIEKSFKEKSINWLTAWQFVQKNQL